MPKKGESDPVKEKHWRKQISDFQSSNCSLSEFCRSRGLSDKNFSNWRKRLALRDANRQNAAEQITAPMDFAPVRVVETTAAAEPIRSAEKFVMEIVLPNKTVLRLAENCSMALMSSAISVLGTK